MNKYKPINLYGTSTLFRQYQIVDEGNPVNADGYTFQADIDRAGTKIAELTISTLTQSGPTLGVIEVRITPTEIAKLVAVGANDFVWDLKTTRTSDGFIDYAIERSPFLLTQAVT